jgi:hypothetical protein
MVERAAAGEAPSSPQPPEAGARRARLYRVSSGAQNRNRQTMPSSWCGAGLLRWELGSRSADFEHVAQLSLAARRLLASLPRGLTLLLADEGESSAKVLVLDNRPLRNLA